MPCIIVHNANVHSIIVYNAIVHSIILHNAILHSIIVHNVIVHSIILHNAIVHIIVVHSIIVHNAIVYSIIVYGYNCAWQCEPVRAPAQNKAGHLSFIYQLQQRLLISGLRPQQTASPEVEKPTGS